MLQAVQSFIDRTSVIHPSKTGCVIYQITHNYVSIFATVTDIQRRILVSPWNLIWTNKTSKKPELIKFLTYITAYMFMVIVRGKLNWHLKHSAPFPIINSTMFRGMHLHWLSCWYFWGYSYFFTWQLIQQHITTIIIRLHSLPHKNCKLLLEWKWQRRTRRMEPW